MDMSVYEDRRLSDHLELEVQVVISLSDMCAGY